MDVPADTIRKIIKHVDIICAALQFDIDTGVIIPTEPEIDGLKMLPGFMDELQRYLDANPPWRR